MDDWDYGDTEYAVSRAEGAPMRTWKYEAKLLRVVDGDTVVCDIDQGMNTWSKGQYVRLAGIDAPEKRGGTKEAGLQAKSYLEALLADDEVIFLVTVEYHEFEKYGRVLAYLFLDDPYVDPADPAEGSVNLEMVQSGNAVVYGG